MLGRMMILVSTLLGPTVERQSAHSFHALVGAGDARRQRAGPLSDLQPLGAVGVGFSFGDGGRAQAHRRLIPWMISCGAAAVAAAATLRAMCACSKVCRRRPGPTGKMRFGEYKGALILIERYPFRRRFHRHARHGHLPGREHVVLDIAENMGLIGLALFIGVMVGFFVMVLATLAARAG